ncbi:MAG: hypothetical protein ACW964_15210 [Candidatus Hodarchaeales archaeon]
MIVPEQFVDFIPFWDLAFFIFGVPFVLWLNNKTRNDLICLGLGILYMILYGLFFEPKWDDWLFFYFGLIVGYVTDYWGVNSNKWKYHPWDPEFGYSYYVGFAWGMVSIFTYNISKIIEANPEGLFMPGILFIIPTVILEWKYGETRRDQYFLFARAFFTLLAFYNNLGLLFVACFVGSYIEFAGVSWVKNWIYIDTMSYIFLSFGYSLLILFANMIVDIIAGNIIEPFVWLFFILAISFYFLDTFYQQKRVRIDKQKAVVAAEQYYKNK